MSRLLTLLPFLIIGLFATVDRSSAQTGVEELRLTVGKSVVIDYPADIARLSTSNPDVVDVQAITTREVLVNAKGQGAATVVVWSNGGQRTFYGITVELNLEPLRRVLKEAFPQEEVHAQAGRDSVTLTGRVSSPATAERVAALAANFGKAVVNNLQVAAPPVDRQILLRVRFASLDRSAQLSLGASIVSTGAGNTIGRITTGAQAAPTTSSLRAGVSNAGGGTLPDFSLSDALNIFAFRPDINLGAVIRALQAQNVLQVLAEPNLITANGKEASFLVGGEYPVPVLQGGSNAGAVTVQFREFGIRLTFNPTITENGTIRMHVRPEVSSIDLANAVNFSGFTIPGLTTRRIDTNVELGLGQSFAIAGLVDDRVTDTITSIPGLSKIPVLGNIFKSKQENKSKSELVVLVTPEVVTPLQPGEALPMPFYPRPFLAPLPLNTKLHLPEPTRPPSVAGSAARSSSDSGSAPKHGSRWSKPFSRQRHAD